MNAPPDRPACALCDSPAHWRGLCHKHGERWRRWGKPPIAEWVAAFRQERLNTCSVCGKRWNGYRNRTTCSEECDRERRRRIALARWHAQPAEIKAAISTRGTMIEREKREKRKRLLPCARPGCAGTHLGFANRRYCSPECKRLVHIWMKRDIRLRKRLARAAREVAVLGEYTQTPHRES